MLGGELGGCLGDMFGKDLRLLRDTVRQFIGLCSELIILTNNISITNQTYKNISNSFFLGEGLYHRLCPGLRGQGQDQGYRTKVQDQDEWTDGQTRIRARAKRP